MVTRVHHLFVLEDQYLFQNHQNTTAYAAFSWVVSSCTVYLVRRKHSHLRQYLDIPKPKRPMANGSTGEANFVVSADDVELCANYFDQSGEGSGPS